MRRLVLLAGLALAAGGALAQGHDHAGVSHPAMDHQGMDHQGMNHHGMDRAGRASAADTPATRDFKASHARMMRAMDVAYTGDPDVDFRLQMIPHHQGAIDMAQVAMRHAKDPWSRQLAESIIVEQQREIADMRAWLTRHGVAAPAPEATYIMNADSYRSRPAESGTRSEAVGQSWAPGAGIR